MTIPTLKQKLLEEFEKKLNGPWSLMLGDSLATTQSKRAFLAGAIAGMEECAKEFISEGRYLGTEVKVRLRTLANQVEHEP